MLNGGGIIAFGIWPVISHTCTSLKNWPKKKKEKTLKGKSGYAKRSLNENEFKTLNIDAHTFGNDRCWLLFFASIFVAISMP